MSLLQDVNSTRPLESPPEEPPAGAPQVSLLRELAVQAALKKSDATDAGKTDVVDKATAVQDVGFNLMRNTINAAGQVTGSDVADYIERAEELNDEVDTVPFGLETDDGQIVKVYVNAEQADKFEETMKNMLGMEDDIEEAINRLTTEFDIVDVVWPKTEDEEEGEEDEDADLTIDDTSNLEDEEDDDFAEDEYEVIASVEDDETSQEKSNKEEEEDEEELDAVKKKSKPKKKPAKAEPAAEGLEAEEPEQEKDMTFGSKFLERVLQEAAEDRDGVKDGFSIPLDSQARALTAKLKLPLAKRLIAFHVMCGVPGRYLNTEDVESAVAKAADMLRKKVAVRRAFITLYEDLANAKGFIIPTEVKEDLTEAEDVKNIGIVLMKGDKLLGWYVADDEEVTKRKSRAARYSRKAALSDLKLLNHQWDLNPGEKFVVMPLDEELTEAKQKRGSFIQKLLETVLVELGLPETLITTTGPAVVGTGIYHTAELIEQDSKLERDLRLLATRLGVKANDVQGSVAEEEELDDAGEIIQEAVNLGLNDDFAKAVVSLASALGVPDAVLTSRRPQLIQGLRQRKASLRNRTQVMTLMTRLENLISKNTVAAGGQPEETEKPMDRTRATEE